jgi:hypothetical protein
MSAITRHTISRWFYGLSNPSIPKNKLRLNGKYVSTWYIGIAMMDFRWVYVFPLLM